MNKSRKQIASELLESAINNDYVDIVDTAISMSIESKGKKSPFIAEPKWLSMAVIVQSEGSIVYMVENGFNFDGDLVVELIPGYACTKKPSVYHHLFEHITSDVMYTKFFIRDTHDRNPIADFFAGITVENKDLIKERIERYLSHIRISELPSLQQASLYASSDVRHHSLYAHTLMPLLQSNFPASLDQESLQYLCIQALSSRNPHLLDMLIHNQLIPVESFIEQLTLAQLDLSKTSISTLRAILSHGIISQETNNKELSKPNFVTDIRLFINETHTLFVNGKNNQKSKDAIAYDNAIKTLQYLGECIALVFDDKLTFFDLISAFADNKKLTALALKHIMSGFFRQCDTLSRHAFFEGIVLHANINSDSNSDYKNIVRLLCQTAHYHEFVHHSIQWMSENPDTEHQNRDDFVLLSLFFIHENQAKISNPIYIDELVDSIKIPSQMALSFLISVTTKIWMKAKHAFVHSLAKHLNGKDRTTLKKLCMDNVDENHSMLHLMQNTLVMPDKDFALSSYSHLLVLLSNDDNVSSFINGVYRANNKTILMRSLMEIRGYEIIDLLQMKNIKPSGKKSLASLLKNN